MTRYFHVLVLCEFSFNEFYFYSMIAKIVAKYSFSIGDYLYNYAYRIIKRKKKRLIS